MGPFANQRNALARGLAAVVACVFLLQVALAGAAVASAGSGDGTFFGAICANEKAPGPDKMPVAPSGGHRHGLCCILHCDALAAPPAKLQLSYVLNFPAEAFAPPSVRSAPATRVDPKRAPQSPRAPPFVS